MRPKEIKFLTPEERNQEDDANQLLEDSTARFPVALSVVAAVAIPALAGPALAGDLDLTFNGDGKVTTNFGSAPTRPRRGDPALRQDRGGGLLLQRRQRRVRRGPLRGNLGGDRRPDDPQDQADAELDHQGRYAYYTGQDYGRPDQLAQERHTALPDGSQKTKFQYDASTDRLSYTSNKLSKGTHTVKIVATNNVQGTSTTETFSFVRK